jgi:hypothetical protein
LRPAATAGLKVTAQILMAGGQPYVLKTNAEGHSYAKANDIAALSAATKESEVVVLQAYTIEEAQAVDPTDAPAARFAFPGTSAFGTFDFGGRAAPSALTPFGRAGGPAQETEDRGGFVDRFRRGQLGSGAMRPGALAGAPRPGAGRGAAAAPRAAKASSPLITITVQGMKANTGSPAAVAKIPLVKTSQFQDCVSITIDRAYLTAGALLMPHARCLMRACFQRPWHVRFGGHS